MKRIFLVIVILIVSFLGGVTIVSNNLNEPYRVADQIIQEAKQDVSQSKHIVDEVTWEEVKGESIYKVVRKEVDWKNFKNVIQEYRENKIVVGPKLNFYYKYKKFSKDYADMYVYIYNSFGEEIYTKRLLMHRINGEWKIVGEDKYN